MTAHAKLNSLTITAFRGSCAAFTLPFETGRNLTIVYGENGTGKTTICDAFDFLAHERISSLDGYGLGKGLEKFWPTAEKSTKDLSVTLDTGAGTCSGRIANKQVVVSPPELRPKIELLRRQQILSLIQAQPKERYDVIRRFIDITEFEVSEATLRQQGKDIADDLSRAQQAEGQSLQELQGFYEASGSPTGLNPVSWAKQKLALPSADLDKDIASIAKLRSTYDGLKAFPERVVARHQTLTVAKAALAEAEQRLAAAAASVSDDLADTLAVLETGDRYLHGHPNASTCPLCRSDEKMAGLATDVASRLASLGALRTATTARRTCATALTTAQSAVDQLATDYERAAGAYKAAKKGHAWDANIKLPSNEPPKDAASLQAWLAANDSIAAGWPDVEASWRDEKKFIATLKSASERYEVNSATREHLQAITPKLDEALNICVVQRQAFTKQIISAIAQEIGELYEKVHPGEGLDAIALPLDPKKRASIELEAKFAGKDVPPQAYFSQSHLDTLGLCVFLALASRDRPAETILILDDVLGSVDEPHVERVVEMIYEVSTRFRHTILTTHYRPWRERFRWGALKPGQLCQFIELGPWNVTNGMTYFACLPETERLRALLKDQPADVQAISSKAGVILEYAADYLTQRYECAVPRRHGGVYTIGDLLPPIGKKLREALSVEIRDGITDPNAAATSVVQLKPVLDEIERIARIRNLMGAHFNAVSFDLLDKDAVAFATHVLKLVDALCHPDHGWPNNDKSGSYWRNVGDSRRLHPLKKPA